MTRHTALTLAWLVFASCAFAQSPSPDASPSPAASPDDSPSVAASPTTTDASPSADASPTTTDASPSADASPTTTDASPSSGEETAAAPDASPSPDASPAEAEKPPEDPFASLGEVTAPRARIPKAGPDPFRQVARPKVKDTKKAVVTGPAARAQNFHISGLLLGRRINAVRIFGRRVEVGKEFDYDEKKALKDKITVVSGGEFKLKSVTDEEIVIEHVDGETVTRSTSLWGEENHPATPEPTPSPKSEESSTSEGGGTPSSTPSTSP